MLNVIDFDVATVVSDQPTGNDCPGFAFAFGNPCPANAFYTYTGGVFPGEGAALGIGVTDLAFAQTWATAIGATGITDPVLFDAGHLNYMPDALFGFGEGSPSANDILFLSPAGDTYSVAHDTTTPIGNARALVFGNRVLAHSDTFELDGAPGSQSVTGIGFQPDLVVFVGCRLNGGDSITGWDSTQFTFGAADGNGNQWVSAARSVFNSGCTVYGALLNQVVRICRFHDAACIAAMGGPEYVTGDATYDQLASLTSMDADGFTLSLSAAQHSDDGIAPLVGYLAIKLLGSSRASVGVATQSDASINVGFSSPEAILFGSAQTLDNSIDHDFLNAMVGCVDTAGQKSTWIGSATSVNCDDWPGGRLAPESIAYTSDSHAIRFSRYDSTLKAEALATLTATGCDLDWTTDDSVARRFGWIAFNIDQGPCGAATPLGIYRDPVILR